MKKLIVFWVMSVSAFNVQAETFEEYMRAQQQEFNAWKSEQDRAFYQFLKEGWKAYDIDPAVVVQKPKPQTLPIAKPKPVLPPPPKKIETPKVLEIVKPKPTSKPITKPITKPALEPIKQSTSQGMPIEFYGKTLYFPVKQSWLKVKKFRAGKLNQQRVAELWKTFAQLETDPMINRLQYYTQALNLNGWGELQLAYTLAKDLTAAETERKLLTWALMVKMDKAIRLGYHGQEVYVLYHSEQRLFNVSYWRYDGLKHYVFEPDGASIEVKKLYSYQGNFSESTQAFNLDYHQNPNLFIPTETRTLSFDYQGKNHQFQMPVSKGYADFMYSLPLQSSQVYFSRMPSQELQKVLIPQVKQAIDGMSEPEAVNFLLAFVQKGLKYKLDKDQFNRSEKYLMPEETLLHVYSDCEDHSFLFTWLVRETLGISVVGLDYPGHIATAVNLSKPRGKTYYYDRKKYVVADPTYINATYGMEMPQFSGSNVKVVPVD